MPEQAPCTSWASVDSSGHKGDLSDIEICLYVEFFAIGSSCILGIRRSPDLIDGSGTIKNQRCTFDDFFLPLNYLRRAGSSTIWGFVGSSRIGCGQPFGPWEECVVGDESEQVGGTRSGRRGSRGL